MFLETKPSVGCPPLWLFQESAFVVCRSSFLALPLHSFVCCSRTTRPIARKGAVSAADNTFCPLPSVQSRFSPALLMMGVNTTETQAALNDSVQLLSMGIVPDSVGISPKLLTSFKDFDDDDKRLDAAYRRQVNKILWKAFLIIYVRTDPCVCLNLIQSCNLVMKTCIAWWHLPA